VILIAADCRMLAGDDFFEKVITRVGKDDFRKLEEIAGKIFDGPDVAIELTPELAGELSRTEAGLQYKQGAIHDCTRRNMRGQCKWSRTCVLSSTAGGQSADRLTMNGPVPHVPPGFPRSCVAS
jgi:hypothetical protein